MLGKSLSIETEMLSLLQVKNNYYMPFFFFLFVPRSVIEKGEENCTHLIEAHKDCMRALGFKI